MSTQNKIPYCEEAMLRIIEGEGEFILAYGQTTIILPTKVAINVANYILGKHLGVHREQIHRVQVISDVSEAALAIERTKG